MRIFIYTVLLFFILAHSATAQKCPSIPEDYSWSTAAEYEHDKDLVKKCLNWLCTNPIFENIEQRSKTNAFVMSWLSGSPQIRMEVNSDALPFLDKNEDLFFVVVHGMARYQFDHPKETDQVKIMAAGLKVLAVLGEEDDTLRKTEYLKPILKAARKDKLEMWVCEQLH